MTTKPKDNPDGTAPAAPAPDLNADPKTDPAEQTVRRDQLDVVDPAAKALNDARDADERAQLEAERDELRKRLGDRTDLAALRAEVDALRTAAARAGAFGQAPFAMSAGVHADLEARGYAVGENGETYVRDGDSVTVTARGTGKQHTVPMPKAPELTEEQTGAKAGRISGQDK